MKHPLRRPELLGIFKRYMAKLEKAQRRYLWFEKGRRRDLHWFKVARKWNARIKKQFKHFGQTDR